MQTKGGWTLIELLVVMAIILVLAGIIYAFVAYAIEKSHQAQCISNLRQIGVALKLYMDDYKRADWDTEVVSIDCERIDQQTSFDLAASWGFPLDSLRQLVSAGYLKGGDEILRCRSFYGKASSDNVDYFYQLPIKLTESYSPDSGNNDYGEYNGLSHLKKRMHEYPIVVDVSHWRINRGGVFVILRLDGRVQTKWLGPLEFGNSLNL